MASIVDLSLRRTFLAYDRTLMAWVRTSLSLISFGFGVDKFFEYLRSAESLPRSMSLIGPRQFGIIMLGIGVVALGSAMLEYRKSISMLEKTGGEEYRSITTTFAAVISVLGLALFAVVLLRL